MAITSRTGTAGSLNALANYWNAATFNMADGTPIITAGDTTDGYGDPGALNAAGTTFAVNCSYYGSTSQTSWAPCPASPSAQASDWREVVASHTPDYIEGNGHNGRVTWTATKASGTYLIPSSTGSRAAMTC